MVEIIAHRYALIGDGARSGGQSVIRKATDLADGSIVAVKLLSGSQDDILKKVFEREISALKSLDHPNIIRLRDSGITDDGLFFLSWIGWTDRSQTSWKRASHTTGRNLQILSPAPSSPLYPMLILKRLSIAT